MSGIFSTTVPALPSPSFAFLSRTAFPLGSLGAGKGAQRTPNNSEGKGRLVEGLHSPGSPVSLVWSLHNPNPGPRQRQRVTSTDTGLLLKLAAATLTASPPCVTQEAACFDKTELQAGKSDKLGWTKAFPLPHSRPRSLVSFWKG